MIQDRNALKQARENAEKVLDLCLQDFSLFRNRMYRHGFREDL